MYDNAVIADATNPNNFYYSDIYIDGNHFGDECCRGVAFSTPVVNFPNYGEIWTGDLPGIPDCTQAEFGEAPATFPFRHDDEPLNNIHHKYGVQTDFAMEQQLQQLSNYLMISIGISVLLFAMISCLIIVMVRKSHKPRTYGKVEGKEYDSDA